MRAYAKTLLCGFLTGAALAGPAAAGETMVMPFTCRVDGGQVLLSPSAPQTYEIYGARERKQLTTCSPYDPRKCHTWSIHRFDLDCGGAKTSWQSVVAALGPMFAETAGAPGGAFAPDAAAEGPARPYRLGPPGQAISFPPGFAPNPMKIATFKWTAPETAQIPIPPKKPDVAPPSEVAAIAPSPTPDAAPSPPEAKSETGDTTAATPKAKQAAEHRALKIEIEHGSGEVTGSLPAPDGGSLWRDAGTVFAVMLAALLALSAALLLRGRTMEALPAPLKRLRGPAAWGALARAHDAQIETAAAPGDASASRLRLWDEDWLPTTMTEALDVLGVDPHAKPHTIKSTVTRLRRALHPDYALDDEDRALRERRLKQINVAWEIVSGKRRSLWLSVSPRMS